ncbi:hypothetical protein BRADI_4g13226v3 [Brachypodium distachyon]|uniref:Uncharacterized protein n=1 Tax=Brachypodium distachyon TaxID=15368 RepID=A0A2K2CMI4_BRADI|nr:hypothetical protein BRADI_4g13226v3 [Brachypodium distachyon]
MAPSPRLRSPAHGALRRLRSPAHGALRRLRSPAHGALRRLRSPAQLRLALLPVEPCQLRPASCPWFVPMVGIDRNGQEIALGCVMNRKGEEKRKYRQLVDKSGGPPQTHTRRPATAETMVNSSPNRLSSPNFALEFLKLDCIGVSRCTAMPNLGLSPLRSRMRPPPFLIRGRRSLPFAPLPFSFEDDAAASEAPAASPRHRYPRRGDAAPFAYPHTRDDRVVSTVKHEKAAKHRRLKVLIQS